jgi:putative membrane protein
VQEREKRNDRRKLKYRRIAKFALLLLGLLCFTFVVYQSGPREIAAQIAELGPWIVLAFLPYVLVYSFDALGWWVTIPGHRRVGLHKTFAVRMAGEAVNYITPSAYLGGEPVKAHLLGRYGIPFSDGIASAVISKTCMISAQILFVILGLLVALSIWKVKGEVFWGIIVSITIGALLCGSLFLLQLRGLFMGFISVLQKLRIRPKFIAKREEKIRKLDRTISGFYSEKPRHFGLSIFFYFLGWALQTFEVYVLLRLLDVPIDLKLAFAIESLSTMAKGAGFFIPGSLGAQEGGIVLLFASFDMSTPVAATYSIVRRLREILWIGIGMVILYFMEIRQKRSVDGITAGENAERATREEQEEKEGEKEREEEATAEKQGKTEKQGETDSRG